MWKTKKIIKIVKKKKRILDKEAERGEMKKHLEEKAKDLSKELGISLADVRKYVKRQYKIDYLIDTFDPMRYVMGLRKGW